MFGIIAIALSILTILAGLAMLAKSRKEALGRMFVISSYASIIGGVCLLLGGIIGGSVLLCKSRCAKSGSCYSQSYNGGQCSQGMMGHGKCGMMGHGKCGMMGQGKCGMMGHGQSGMMGHGQCGMMGHGQCAMMQGDPMMKKCFHKGKGDKKIEIEIEVDDDEDNETEE